MGKAGVSLIHRIHRSPGEWARALRFGLVGVALTAFDFAVFRIVLALGLDQGIARLSASVASVIVSYPIHRGWSFQSKRTVRETVLSYFATRAAAALIIQAVFWISTGPLGLGSIASFWVSTLLYPVVNFAFARFFVFRE